MNQIQSILTLYSEILLVLGAATILGWFVGYMMKGVRARRKFRSARRSWKSRYKSLEETARSDADNLEEQLQSLAQETKTLQSTNKVLTDSLKKNDSSIQKARAEAIELNRQHAETQERLQRIIQQKDREIVELGHKLSNSPSSAAVVSAPIVAPGGNTAMSNPITGYGDNDNDLNYADTVAINPSVVPAEPLDATVQMSVQEQQTKANEGRDYVNQPEPNAQLDETSDMESLGFEEIEEPTVALDDEALAFAQRSYPARRRGD